MKVCTDSCLFGAWIPINDHVERVLDIGTGTGLLALMVAQRSNALVDAIELQTKAAQEAKTNVEQSAFENRITVYPGNILDSSLEVYQHRYDVIVCNPPFFPNHLQPDDAADVTARHDVELPLNKLLNAIEILLTENGSAFLLLPYEPFKSIESISTKALKLAQAAAVNNYHDKPPIRWMVELKKNVTELKRDEIVIYNADRTYTNRFIELLTPYYLYL
jgi:tRNA1Val (adenine37-N6)-methyltransferase